jgi:hypothetical protein
MTEWYEWMKTLSFWEFSWLMYFMSVVIGSNFHRSSITIKKEHEG